MEAALAELGLELQQEPEEEDIDFIAPKGTVGFPTNRMHTDRAK